MTAMRTSIHGRRLGLGPDDELISNEIQISQPAADVSITIAASQTSPRAVTLQFKNARGENLAQRVVFEVAVYADAAGVAFATTGGSTGLAADGNSGDLVQQGGKKLFLGHSDATGKWTGTWTDTAHEVCFMGVWLPTGRQVLSAALTTA